MKEDIKSEEAEQRKEELARSVKREMNPYDHLVQNLTDPECIPEIPVQAQNAFVINLFCIDQKYESRSGDFFQKAFELYKDRDYIILTQPHTIMEQTLLSNFIQVKKKQDSIFDHVLYVMHKDALFSENIIVRKSEVQDIEAISDYVLSLKNVELIQKDMNEAIKENASKKTAYSVFCNEAIIGMYVLTKSVNLDYYVSHFCVQDHIILQVLTRGGLAHNLFANDLFVFEPNLIDEGSLYHLYHNDYENGSFDPLCTSLTIKGFDPLCTFPSPSRDSIPYALCIPKAFDP